MGGLYFYIFHLSSISNVLSFLEMAEHDRNTAVSAVKPQR